MFNGNLFEQGVDIIPDNVPQDNNTDLTGDYINLANKDRAYLCVFLAGASSDTDNVLHLDLDQATDNGGTGAKAAAVVTKFWYKSGSAAVPGVMTGAATWTAVELGTAVSDLDMEGYDVGTQAMCFIFEILPENLDVDGGFTHVRHHQEADTFADARVGASWWITTGDAYAKAIPNSAL